MEIEPLELRHQKEVRELLQKVQQPLVEYSFAHAFLFRDVYKSKIARGTKNYILGEGRDHYRYAMPLYTPQKEDLAELSSLSTEADVLFPIPEEWLPLFSEYHKNFSPAESDYLYSVDKLSHYPGRHLSGKRNLVKQFLSFYNPTSTPLLQNNIESAHELLLLWQASLSDHRTTDLDSCNEMLSLWGKIEGLEGRLYFANGKVIGMIIGEAITKDCYAFHFAKADKNYKGVYQYIYQHYAQQLQGRYLMINLEQDLGNPSLRQSKESYIPDTKGVKWRVWL